MSRIKEGMMRTHTCGELTISNIDNSVQLCGWVNKDRNLGGLHFIDLRDKYGLTQLSFAKYEGNVDLKSISLESVIKIGGTVSKRPDEATNKNMITGEIEVLVSEIIILSQSEKDNIPFLPNSKIRPTEELALKYRYLDLRTERLQNILKKRSITMNRVRHLLLEEDFVEVETPILYKSTPEGARDYIVPSRTHPNKVYALPQSPQTLKQLLMIASTDKYFQITKCFRDEDLRADRQPEFTQIDIEASFGSSSYIKNLVEKIIKDLFKLDNNFKIPFMSFKDAMNLYGSDKPDLRFGLKHMVVTDLFEDSEFKTFSDICSAKGLIKAIFLPNTEGSLSRKIIDGFKDIVAPYGGSGVAWFKVDEEKKSGGISKFISEKLLTNLQASCDEKESSGTWMFLADENHEVAHASADGLRRHLGKTLDLVKDSFEFLWINDFPILEWNEDDKRFYARHHPFTQPASNYLDDFMSGETSRLKNCLADAYDLVCNGYEVAGGSTRIHNQEVQKQMFKVLGMDEQEVKHMFGFFIEALQYGVPPHGGIAFGADRLMMLLSGTENIRDVISFPKTTSAMDLMASAPSAPSEGQLNELKMQWKK